MADDTKPNAHVRRAHIVGLEEIASRPRPPEVQALPSNEVVEELVRAFGDAVLSLYNNTLRVCGVHVGDALSEGNWGVIDRGLVSVLRTDIARGLAAERQAHVARLEADAAAADAEIDRLCTARSAAFQEAYALAERLTEARKARELLSTRIAALKESI